MAQSVSAAPKGQAFASAEAKIRQMIAAGKDKAAVDAAKDLHKLQRSPASESLLLDAYAARIRSLNDRNLTIDAKALLDSVRERYPAAHDRFRDFGSDGSLQSRMAELVRPLNEPDPDPERRAAIEQTIAREVTDLALIADAASLPPEHPLRQAASALRNAFTAVTSGPIEAAALELPEVSRKSPLAGWKLLIRAIGCFYRREDDECRRYLTAINPESAPARLVGPIEAALGDKSIHLTQAGSALAGSVTSDPAPLRKALDDLERALRTADDDRTILNAVRHAVQTCRAIAPDKLDQLTALILARGAAAGLQPDQLSPAVGGTPKPSAFSSRLVGRALEDHPEYTERTLACAAWASFGVCGVDEGLITAGSPEQAMVYLRIAHILEELPRGLVEQFLSGDDRVHNRRKIKREFEEAPYWLDPNELFSRACAIDPQKDSFVRWLDWAKGGPEKQQAERVAETWHKARPGDIEPILYLMEVKEGRGAFKTSLEYLAKAEQIDAVNPSVRRARLRLLAGSVIRHLQQKKPHLAEQKLEELSALPQSRQGARPAFIEALRYVTTAVHDGREAASKKWLELELSIGRTKTCMLLFAVARAGKQPSAVPYLQVSALSKQEKAELPAAVAWLLDLSKDVEMSFAIPTDWLRELDAQFERQKSSLDIAQLLTLCEAAIASQRLEFGFHVSVEGLERGGDTVARFLFFRAASMPDYYSERKAVCAAAAAHLARKNREMWVVQRANNILAHSLHENLRLEGRQAEEVVRREKAERNYPTYYKAGPDYADILGADEPCDCPACRRERGEEVFDDDYDDDFDKDFGDDFDEDDIDEIIASFDLPADMPPQLRAVFAEEVKQAIERGESPEEFINRIAGHGPGTRKKKRKRR